MEFTKGTALLINGNLPMDVVSSDGTTVRVMADYKDGQGVNSKVFSVPTALFTNGAALADGTLAFTIEAESLRPYFKNLYHRLVVAGAAPVKATWEDIPLEVTESGTLNRSTLSVDQQIALNNLEVRVLEHLEPESIERVASLLGVPFEILSMHLAIIAADHEMSRDVVSPGAATHKPFQSKAKSNKAVMGDTMTTKKQAELKEQEAKMAELAAAESIRQHA